MGFPYRKNFRFRNYSMKCDIMTHFGAMLSHPYRTRRLDLDAFPGLPDWAIFRSSPREEGCEPLTTTPGMLHRIGARGGAGFVDLVGQLRAAA